MAKYLAIVLLIALAVLVACAPTSGGRRGRGETPVATPTPTPTLRQQGASPTATPTPTTSQAGTPASGEKRRGGRLVRLWSDPPTLDPHLTTDVSSAFVIIEVYGGLVTIDPELKIVPDLAQSWEVSNGGRTYTFHLRQDAKFHNGKPVTAQDFKWSMERAADPRTLSPVVDQYLGDIVGVKDKLAGRATEVQGVRVIDEHTLELTIDAPKTYFLAKLTYPTAFVLDRENVEGDRAWTRRPNGTGPFKLAEYILGERILLERNDNYHLGPAYLDSVELLLGGGTAMLMYENGEIDMTGVGLADIDRVLDPNNPLNKELHIAPTDFSLTYIGMNVTMPPFDDIKVRQALNYALNREEIASIVLGDLALPAKGILPPGFPAYNPDRQGFTYDPERARQLLQESKYNDPATFPRITLTVAGGFGASVGLDLEVILESWRQNLGINVEVQQVEFATFLQDLQRKRFQMFETGWIADYPDPENFLDVFFHTGSVINHSAYSNPEVDRLLEEARVEQDQQRRFQLYRQVEDIVLEELPVIPLWHSGERHVLIKPYIHDYFLVPLVIPKLRYVYSTK